MGRRTEKNMNRYARLSAFAADCTADVVYGLAIQPARDMRNAQFSLTTQLMAVCAHIARTESTRTRICFLSVCASRMFYKMLMMTMMVMMMIAARQELRAPHNNTFMSTDDDEVDDDDDRPTYDATESCL